MIHQEIKISPPLCLAGPPGRAGQGVPGGAQVTSWCREGEGYPSLCSELHEANPWTSFSICILEGKKGRRECTCGSHRPRKVKTCAVISS